MNNLNNAIKLYKEEARKEETKEEATIPTKLNTSIAKELFFKEGIVTKEFLFWEEGIDI